MWRTYLHQTDTVQPAGTQIWIQTGNVVFQVEIGGASIQMQYYKWPFASCAIPLMVFPWPVICTYAHKCVPMSSPKWSDVWHTCVRLLLQRGERPDSILQHAARHVCAWQAVFPIVCSIIMCVSREQTHMCAKVSFPWRVWCTCGHVGYKAAELFAVLCLSGSWAPIGLALVFSGQWTLWRKCWKCRKP